MQVSQARIDANRRNAQLSTGPVSEAGKRSARANALKHGLCASTVVPEDLESVQRRSDEMFYSLKPFNGAQAWMVDRVAITSLRIERCERMERRARDKHALKAELSWESDRRIEAEALGRTLPKDPSGVAEALKRTPQGCEWLMGRWALLAHAADSQDGAWTVEQTRIAFDLLGTPAAFREGRKPGVEVDLHGHVVDPAEHPAAVARRQVDALDRARGLVADLDEVERHLASSDLTDEGNPELKRLRRYESALHSKLRWFVSQVRCEWPHRKLDEGLRKQWVVDPDAEPEAAPRPEPKSADEVAAEGWTPAMGGPPFCLTPDEYPAPGREIDLPAILTGRREKRLRKAESRREADRRKADRLREAS